MPHAGQSRRNNPNNNRYRASQLPNPRTTAVCSSAACQAPQDGPRPPERPEPDCTRRPRGCQTRNGPTRIRDNRPTKDAEQPLREGVSATEGRKASTPEGKMGKNGDALRNVISHKALCT